jgi:NADH dehydrogenase
MANVQEIDASTKILIINIGAINYDYLVLATGSVTNFFGNTEIKKTEWS